ncbi:hypothetical protein SASPL_109977 [Salvia splendens]|uniref:Uncharacterized protein n=1 Tax=Salvia splendens TaxID=180675 RepID=A0A8X9A2C3_SALSN|nr:hypothetical protein SASPL_109977 [Salvia splendens]
MINEYENMIRKEYIRSGERITWQNGRVGLGVIFRDEKGVDVFACKTELRVAGSTSLIRGLNGDVDLDPYIEVVKDDILAIARRVGVIDFQFIYPYSL